MYVSASDLRSRARLKLKNNYWNAVLVTIVQGAILSIASPAVIVLGGALTIGTSAFFLHNADRQQTDISDLFTPFKQQFGNSIIYFIVYSLLVTLWTLLFIIPGIIAGFAYAMTPYILAEHPEISAVNALKMSKDMMKGNKGRYFCLQLSFIGWVLLGFLTCGIGLFFLIPYVQAANAEFFNEVSGKNAQRGTFDPAAPGFGFENDQNPYNHQNPCEDQNNRGDGYQTF